MTRNEGSLLGDELPRLVTDVPGPASRALGRRLRAVESRNLTRIADDWPIFWVEARGAAVRDADGNTFLDLTGGFAVAAAGHANPRVADAVAEQVRRLPHALGDVHPAEIKVRLLERLAELAPGDLRISILAGSGAEAVEAALKTAVLRTGRAGVVAFTGAYHGLSYGALAATWGPHFREPFREQLYQGILFAPYPHPYRWQGGGDPLAGSLDAVRNLLERTPAGARIGAVLVEPIQGRGGIVVPPPGFLRGLRELCDRLGAVLVFDEVYTGFGRTGRWFACEHEGVTPDLLVLGKALGGGLPLSAVVGTPGVMQAWPPSTGEAIHTSTFLGNPVACAAALAHLEEISERDLVERAGRLGRRLRERLDDWVARYAAVGEVRGVGLLQGVELVADRASRAPASELAGRLVLAALRRGILLLSEGPAANVLAFSPPLVITERQLDHALTQIEHELARSLSP